MSKVTAIPTRTAAVPAVRVLLYTPDNRYQARLESKLAGFADLQWEDSREIAPPPLAMRQAGWRLALLDYSNGNATYSAELTQQLRLLMPELPVVAVGPAGAEHASGLLAALRAGARDYIDVDGSAEEIQASLQKVLAQPLPARAAAVAPQQQTRGKVVVLLGSRAGVGSTTLASQLGALLASPDKEDTPNEARRLLLDLGLPSGDAALYLDTDAAFHYEDALRNLSRIDATLARTALAHHESGLAILGHASGSLPPQHDPSALLERLRGVFGLTVCDLGGVPPQHLPLALLQIAQEIWVITDQTLGALVSLDHLLKSLEARNLRDERLQLLVNRYDDSYGMSAEQLAQRFALPLLATLPDRSRALRASAAEGRLLSQQAPNDPYLKALAPLLRRLDPTATPDSPPAGLRERLARQLSGLPWKSR